jgi:hypothetical protein
MALSLTGPERAFRAGTRGAFNTMLILKNTPMISEFSDWGVRAGLMVLDLQCDVARETDHQDSGRRSLAPDRRVIDSATYSAQRSVRPV